MPRRLFLTLLLVAAPLAAQSPPARDSGTKGAVERARDAKDYAGAIPLLEAAVARTPADAFAWYWLGESRRATDRLSEATTAFRQALTLDKAYDAFPTWFRLGLVYTARGNRDRQIMGPQLGPQVIAERKRLMRDSAIAAFRRAAELETRGTSALESLLPLVEGAEAEQVRAAIAAKNPTQPQTDAVRAAAERGDWAAAAVAQTERVRRDTTDYRAWVVLADFRLRARDTAGALQAAQGAVTANADPMALQALGQLFLNGRPSVARQLFGRSLAISKDTTAPLMLALGRAFVLEGRAEQSLAVFQRGVRADSTNAALWTHTGIALGQLNRWPAAVSVLRRALRFSKGDEEFEIRYLLGVAAHKAGNSALADEMEAALGGSRTDSEETAAAMVQLLKLQEARKAP